uniref:uncharacterized protein LOC120348435 n=1 Tax=Styela clava TaxID=7725 RepID=UPI001939D529|nr:uncharacterized protein LOC120348435 [Styela clava]
MKTLLVLILTVWFQTSTTEASLCPNATEGQVIDWEKLGSLNTYWYDVIDIPKPATDVDCWDWKHICPVQDGLRATLVQYVEGGTGKHQMKVHFILNEDGSYSWDIKNKRRFRKKTKKALDHKINDQMIEDIDVQADLLFKLKFWFMTDYENYFIVGTCAAGEDNIYGAFIKFNKQNPPVSGVLDIWNRFSDLDESPQVYLKTACINRHPEVF